MRTFRKRGILLFLWMCASLPFTSFAQAILNGEITSSTDKTPIEGATVKVRATDRIVQTDKTGHFSIKASAGETLEITHTSFETLLHQITSLDGGIVLQMTPRVGSMNEVVVVGYGQQKKVNLTGAVSVVKGDALVNRPTTTVSQALQGQVAGMNFGAGTFGFEPGAALNLQIRGQGTPLILVDGVYTTSLNGLNPNDIASISVLKDAAASAIYGARAPYGVILITTKNGGTANKLNIEYSGNYSFIKPINMPHHLDSYTTALALNEAAINSGITPLFNNGTVDRILAYQADPLNTPETVPSAANPKLWANTFESNANYDWFDVYYGNGERYQHNLSFSGGNKGVSFYLSGGYVYDGGVLQIGTDKYKRYNANARFDATLAKWARVTYNSRFYQSSRNTPAYDNQGNYELLFHQIARTFPSQFMKSKYGVYSVQSKVPWTKDAGNENTTINDFVQRVALELTPAKGWTINGDYSIDYTQNNFTSKNFTVYEDNVDGTPVVSGSTSPSFIAKSQASTFYQSVNLYSTYRMDLGADHHLSIMGGFQQEKSNFSYLWARRNNLITPDVPTLRTATGTIDAIDNLSNYATQGYFARFNYNYADRYLLELNARYDGTYKFAEGKKWGFFPSVSAAWVVSNEAFWENLKPTINLFKVRGSWGSLGNQLTALAYQDISLLGVNSNLPWLISGTRPSYTTAPSLVNPDLTWETANTLNFGLDLGMLSNRLTFTGEIYQRKSKDQLGPFAAVPATIGVTTLPQANNMETKTNGWEISLGWNDRIGQDFKYSILGQLFDYKTEITKYNNPTKILTNPYAGQTTGEIWGYTSQGLIQDQATADAINTSQSQKAISGQIWKTGDMAYADLNKDGAVNFGANTADNAGDRRVIGNITPRYQFGVTFRMEWKGFDFSMFWQGVGKRDLMLSDNFFWGFTAPIQSSVFKGHLDYYRDVDATKYAGLGKNSDSYFARPYLDANMNAKNQISQTRYLQNAAYGRLKNLQIGYNFQNTVLDRIHLRGIYFYVSGENLLTFTELPDHFDPENANLGSRGPGKSFFPQQALTLGVNLKF